MDQNGVAIIKHEYHSNGTFTRHYFAPDGAEGGLFGHPEAVHKVELYNSSEVKVEEQWFDKDKKLLTPQKN